MVKTLNNIKRKSKRKTNKIRIPKSNKTPLIFGRIYSSTCFYCQEMEKDWKKLCDNTNIPFINISSNNENYISILNEKFDSTLENKGYPTIFKILNKGVKKRKNIDYYTGPRKYKLMKMWLSK